MPFINAEDIKKGAVLVKVHDEEEGTSRYIKALQTVKKAGSINQAGMFPELMHVAMSLGGELLVESGGKGVERRLAEAKYYTVFEYADDEVASKAADLMSEYADKKNWYSVQEFVTGYPSAMLGNSSYGLMAKIRAWRMDKASFLSGWTGLICSEAVVLFYQVAARKLKKGVPIRLDSNHTSPMKLVQHFGTNDNWAYVGLYSPWR